MKLFISVAIWYVFGYTVFLWLYSISVVILYVECGGLSLYSKFSKFLHQRTRKVILDKTFS